MDQRITVYSYRRCPFAIRVRMTLHEKNLSFEVVEENLKNFSPELRKLHPEAKVPVLVHGEHVLYESSIITEYIEEAFPDPALLPAHPKLKSEIRLWTYWCNQIFKPDIDRYKYGPSRLSEEEVQAATQRLGNHLKKLNTNLETSAWLVGESLSLADIHVFPFFRQLIKTQPEHPELAQFPKLKEWLSRITERPSFEKTMAKPNG